jgi:DNA replication protein DnaC
VSSIEEALILSHLRTLKLPAIRTEYAAVARRAQKDGWSYEAYLQELLDVETRSREEHMASKRLKEAHFPEVKTLDQIDWDAMAGVSRQKVAQLASGEFIEKAEDVIIGGPIGTGKTHLAIALGVQAAKRRTRVSFLKAAELVRMLLEARDDRMLGQLQARLRRVTLLIIDELGFVPLSKTGAELLFEVFSRRYERSSTLVTSNLPFNEWTEAFGSERLTGALLDRLTHHVHILEMNGDSYRLKDSKRKRPPKPRS